MKNNPEKRGICFSKSRSFYHSLFSLLITIAVQNLIAYSINIIDNLMLGSYSQIALDGAATANQIFFLVQQSVLCIGDALVVLASQYWGKGEVAPIRKLTGAALKFSVLVAGTFTLFCIFWPARVIGLFTNDQAIIEEGVRYLRIVCWSYLIFSVTNVLMAALRAVEIVKVSLYISVVSLLVNALINYCLIFGNFGMPRMGIQGAAIGTLIARCVELVICLAFVARDKRLGLFSGGFFETDQNLNHDFVKTCVPVFLSGILWAVTVPMQTAILGHLPGENVSDVLAANSVSSTFYQYLKVIVTAMGSASGVMIGKAIGEGNIKEVKAEGRSISVICVCIGALLSVTLYLLRDPLLSLYSLTPEALDLARQMLTLFAVVMLFMSYQMPVSNGLIRGGGDTHFYMMMNLISVWGIVMPLSLLSAFLWKWPAIWVVLVIQSDQFFKCIPVFLRTQSSKWIHKMTT